MLIIFSNVAVLTHFYSLFQAYSTMEEHTCLLRENMSNLLLSNGSRESVEIDKGQSSLKQVTTLGPGNMALATPALVTDQESTRTKGKRSIQETERPEEQVNVHGRN